MKNRSNDNQTKTKELESQISLLREDIDEVTIQLINLIKARNLITKKINRLKEQLEAPLDDTKREKEIMDKIEQFVTDDNEKAGEDLVDVRTVQTIMDLLISDSKKL
jgi:chorismate mutase